MAHRRSNQARRAHDSACLSVHDSRDRAIARASRIQPTFEGRGARKGYESQLAVRIVGKASVHHGSITATGEHVNRNAIIAAYKTLLFGSMVTVINHHNGSAASRLIIAHIKHVAAPDRRACESGGFGTRGWKNHKCCG
jgi:rare lipoprotein A (peptidoglycan hydrolase)